MLVDFFFGDFTEIADKFVAGFRLEIALVEDDAEWALELEVFDVHGMSDAGLFKVAHGPAGHDSDAKSVDDGALDGGDAADLHDDVEVFDVKFCIDEGLFKDEAAAGTGFANDERFALELGDGDLLGVGPAMILWHDEHELIAQDVLEEKLLVSNLRFDEADVEITAHDLFFDVLGVVDLEGDIYVWIIFLEFADDIRQHVFTNGAAGADHKLALDVAGELLHLAFELGLQVVHGEGVLEQEFAGLGELDMSVDAVKKLGLIILLEGLDLETDRGLSQVQRFCRFGKVFLIRYGDKNF